MQQFELEHTQNSFRTLFKNEKDTNSHEGNPKLQHKLRNLYLYLNSVYIVIQRIAQHLLRKTGQHSLIPKSQQ